ncbi:MAG TPA: 1-deoxy-D-xylulose-5-phosphate reductoisomerase [Thermotogota bacterium]|nr:1-deoxy-D-xylulose-5-phosphate reductoisomerase [Thermotogota bacterium]HRW91321.1 1-deoxy-D-xylulose-5-phosphate reductoisomerase [Thermotogota bacterium]
MKSLVLIGSTGSIGTRTLQVLRSMNREQEQIRLVGLAARSNPLFLQQLLEWKPRGISFAKPVDVPWEHRFFADPVAMLEALQPDICLVASSGGESLRFTLKALEVCSRVALANKESLVLAGKQVMQAARENHCELLPVDSEHSGLFQLLQGEEPQSVHKYIITASGGALRGWTEQQKKHATIHDVLQHPTWKMGEKITVDSATMCNKGLEVIEAHHLYGASARQIEVFLSSSSYVHAALQMQDGVFKVHAGPPDMRIPIAYALSFPHRQYLPEWGGNEGLHVEGLLLEKLELSTQPALELAFEILEQPNALHVAYNAANEAAVHLFLSGKIHFPDIFAIVSREVHQAPVREMADPEAILEWHRRIKQKIWER